LLLGILIILGVGFILGELAGRLGLPKLIGMLFGGILIGPHVLNILTEPIYNISDEIRLFVLLVILFKAGLGLDKEKLMAQGSVALRLGFIPCIMETLVVAAATRWLLGWGWLYCFLLGWIICAASPAVIVPMMLKLKSEGWGAKKGIPDLVLAGGTLSDAVAVTMFGITTAWIMGNGQNTLFQMGTIPVKIIMGLAIGYAAGRFVLFVIEKVKLRGEVIPELIISLGMGILLLVGERYLPYSDYLAIMVMGFIILELDTVLARRLRGEVGKVWQVGEIFLFVLIGAVVDIGVVSSTGFIGIAIIAIGLILGRTFGIWISTWRSILNVKERLFTIIAQSPKATVQAAIGGIPLALGIRHGEYILAIAVLSIIVTAPLGAFGTKYFTPKFLKKGEVDPTKVTVKEDYRFLVAVDDSPESSKALKEAARIARQVDAELVIVNVFNKIDKKLSSERIERELEVVRDLEHEFLMYEGDCAKLIVDTALSYDVDYIYMGKTGESSDASALMGRVSKKVVEKSPVPVILVEDGSDEVL